jgi:hypothetical protein
MKQFMDCYYNMNNTVDAESGNEAIKTKQKTLKYIIDMSLNQMVNMQNRPFRCILMRLWCLIYDERAAISEPNYLQLMGIEEAFVLEMISVNSSRSDFGAVLMMTCFIC